MPHPKIDATLDLLTDEELADAHRFVEVWERAGYMGPAEASAWRERIAIWRRFGRGGQKPVADIPLLDDPDPFLTTSCAGPLDRDESTRLAHRQGRVRPEIRFAV